MQLVVLFILYASIFLKAGSGLTSVGNVSRTSSVRVSFTDAYLAADLPRILKFFCCFLFTSCGPRYSTVLIGWAKWPVFSTCYIRSAKWICFVYVCLKEIGKMYHADELATATHGSLYATYNLPASPNGNIQIYSCHICLMALRYLKGVTDVTW